MENRLNEHRSKMAKVIDKACRDEAFRKRFLAEPVAVLEECGISVPAGLEIKVVEQTDTLKHLVIPFKPEDAEGGSWMCGDDSYDAPCIRCH